MEAMALDMPFGRLCLEERDGRLVRIAFLPPEASAPLPPAATTPLLREARRQLLAYAEGRLKVFDLPVSPQGTAFQRKIWEVLQGIGWGETLTYGEVARAAGSPLGARAAGMACRGNPLLIVVPCHRVLGAGGRLGGFACGLGVKRWLLEREGGRTFALPSYRAGQGSIL